MKKGLPANIPTTSAICSATEPDISCFKVQCSLAPRQQGVVQFVRGDYLSEATSRRSAMGVCAGQASAKLALRSRLRATSGAMNRQRLFLGDFHCDMMQRRWAEECSILTSAWKKSLSRYKKRRFWISASSTDAEHSSSSFATELSRVLAG